MEKIARDERQLSPGQDLFAPAYYISPDMAAEPERHLDRIARPSGRILGVEGATTEVNLAEGDFFRDTPETYWVLTLKQDACVQGDPGDDLNTEDEENVQAFQLILDNYDKYRKLVGKGAIVKGTLLQGFTGHHHTPVLLYVDSIKKDPADKDLFKKSPVKKVLAKRTPAKKVPVKRDLVKRESTTIAQAR